jgi:hypothetical protein
VGCEVSRLLEHRTVFGTANQLVKLTISHNHP